MNKNRPKGNHKHLTLEDRIAIEQGLKTGDSFRKIAAAIGKDPSTISKEVRGHAIYPERRLKDFSPIPCAHNYDPERPHARICTMRHACGDADCARLCWMCEKYHCSEVCEHYEERECEKLSKPPYCCNSCPKKNNCLMIRKIYSSKHAQDNYELLLRSSREGINQTPERIQEMDDLLTPLIRKGQSIGHIYATHAEELGCSRTTLYAYIDAGVFEIRNIDLRRRVKYKARKSSTRTSVRDMAFRKGHSYEDFSEMLEKNPPGSIVEMDTVEGRKGSGPCFLTMLFRSCRLMLIFLLKSQTQDEVRRIFDLLNETLGTELFRKLFEVILTDYAEENTMPKFLSAA